MKPKPFALVDNPRALIDAAESEASFQKRVTILVLEVPGPPAGQARPRFTSRGHVYSPDVGGYKDRIVDHAVAAGWKQYLTDGPVQLEIWVSVRMPKSWSRKKQETMDQTLCARRPDLDNVLKGIMDALQGVIYHNDAQIVEVEIVRLWDDRDATGIQATILSGRI